MGGDEGCLFILIPRIRCTWRWNLHRGGPGSCWESLTVALLNQGSLTHPNLKHPKSFVMTLLQPNSEVLSRGLICAGVSGRNTLLVGFCWVPFLQLSQTDQRGRRFSPPILASAQNVAVANKNLYKSKSTTELPTEIAVEIGSINHTD